MGDTVVPCVNQKACRDNRLLTSWVEMYQTWSIFPRWLWTQSCSVSAGTVRVNSQLWGTMPSSQTRHQSNRSLSFLRRVGQTSVSCLRTFQYVTWAEWTLAWTAGKSMHQQSTEPCRGFSVCCCSNRWCYFSLFLFIKRFVLKLVLESPEQC